MKTTIKFLSIGFLLLLFQFGFSNTPTKTLPASVQLIHASSDQQLKAVDIYINGKIFIDDFQYKSATPFISVPSNMPLMIAIARSDSQPNGKSLYNLNVTLAPEQMYVIVATGMVSRFDYSPFKALQLNIFNQGRSTSGQNSIKMLFFNAASDAPNLGLAETKVPIGVIASNVGYGEFFGYITLNTGNYQLNVFNSSLSAPRPSPVDNLVIAAFSLPLESLRLQGQAVTLLAIGFIDREANAAGESLGLFLAVPTGGPLIPLAKVALAVQDFATSGIVMYPNPASTYVNIGIPFAYNKVSARILDISGREVRRIDALDKQINIADLTNGMYLLNLEIDDQVYMQKFYVNSQK